jgi:hypothetical protein
VASDAAQASGISQDAAIQHVLFMNEYLWQHADNRPHPWGRRLHIIDMKGMGFMDMGSAPFEFAKMVGALAASVFSIVHPSALSVDLVCGL